MMSEFKYTTLGFVGLGAMGRPMVDRLAKKLPEETKIFIFDVVEKILDEVCAEFPEKVSKCADAREVADKSVLYALLPCYPLVSLHWTFRETSRSLIYQAEKG